MAWTVCEVNIGDCYGVQIGVAYVDAEESIATRCKRRTGTLSEAEFNCRQTKAKMSLRFGT